jgi:hypothetical protein
MTSPWPGAIACVLVLLALGSAIATLVQHLRARRNEKQIEAERVMRRGFRAAARLGWLNDDTH